MILLMKKSQQQFFAITAEKDMMGKNVQRAQQIKNRI